MVGYGGQMPGASAEWMEQSPPASPHHFLGSSSEAHLGLEGFDEYERGPRDDLVSQLKRELDEAQYREIDLVDSVDFVTSRLFDEMDDRRAREEELIQERIEVETLTEKWKPLCLKAMECYQESEERFRLMFHGLVDTKTHFLNLRRQLAIKQTALDEKNKTIFVLEGDLDEKDKTILALEGDLDEKDKTILALEGDLDEKDKTILALEGDKKAYFEEMRYVINGSITTLWEISEQVHDLTQDLKEFQLRSKVSTAKRIRPYREMPPSGTLLSCAEHVSKKIHIAKAELAKASREWKNAEAGLEMTRTYVRKSMLANILGKGVPAAPAAPFHAGASSSGEGTSGPYLDESME